MSNADTVRSREAWFDAFANQCDRWITPDPWGGYSPDVHRIVDIILEQLGRRHFDGSDGP